MNPFLREHAGPIVGSTLLHLLVAASALVATWYAVAPKITPPAAIEAYLAAAPAPHAQPAAPVAAPPEPTPAPAPAPPEQIVPAPPPPDPAALAAKAHAEEEAALSARREEARREEARRLEQQADERAADSARQKQRDADARRRTEALAEARRRAEAEAVQRRAEAEAAKRAAADAAAKRQAVADAKLRAARETDLAKELAAEEQRNGAVNAGLQARYAAEIAARVERAWNRPPTAKPGLHCTVLVTQVPGGTVTDVKLGACNGDSAVQQSIPLAVYRASPLPPPPDPSLFERNLKLEFTPHD